MKGCKGTNCNEYGADDEHSPDCIAQHDAVTRVHNEFEDRDNFEREYVKRANELGAEMNTKPDYMRALRTDGNTYGKRPYLNGMYHGWQLRARQAVTLAEAQRDAAALAEAQRDAAALAEAQRDAAYAALDAVAAFVAADAGGNDWARNGWTADQVVREVQGLLIQHGVHARGVEAPKDDAGKAFNDYYHKVPADMPRDKWDRIYRFIATRILRVPEGY
jgi:hypothetical protein